MPNPLITKLQAAIDLTARDNLVLHKLCINAVKRDADVNLIEEGDKPEYVHVILDGFACRYKSITESRRQITSILMPGDSCNLNVVMLPKLDYSISTLTPCKVVKLSLTETEGIIRKHPRIARAFWVSSLVDESIARMRLSNIGQRDAFECLAHFLCEFIARMQLIERVTNNSCEFPITQPELADTLGMTTVHINRNLQKMRSLELISLYRKKLTILDVEKLQSICKFDPSYLHLVPRVQSSDDLRC